MDNDICPSQFAADDNLHETLLEQSSNVKVNTSIFHTQFCFKHFIHPHFSCITYFCSPLLEILVCYIPYIAVFFVGLLFVLLRPRTNIFSHEYLYAQNWLVGVWRHWKAYAHAIRNATCYTIIFRNSDGVGIMNVTCLASRLQTSSSFVTGVHLSL